MAAKGAGVQGAAGGPVRVLGHGGLFLCLIPDVLILNLRAVAALAVLAIFTPKACESPAQGCGRDRDGEEPPCKCPRGLGGGGEGRERWTASGHSRSLVHATLKPSRHSRRIFETEQPRNCRVPPGAEPAWAAALLSSESPGPGMALSSREGEPGRGCCRCTGPAAAPSSAGAE